MERFRVNKLVGRVELETLSEARFDGVERRRVQAAARDEAILNASFVPTFLSSFFRYLPSVLQTPATTFRTVLCLVSPAGEYLLLKTIHIA